MNSAPTNSPRKPLSGLRLARKRPGKSDSKTARRGKRKSRRSISERLEDRRLLAQDVAGTLTEDTSWSDVIRVTGDVTVPEGVKLTIDPGTVVKFAPGRFLSAVGTLDAIGSASDPIIFTAITDDSVGGDTNEDGDASTPYPGTWEAIYLSGPDSRVQHAEVRFAGDTNGDGIGSGATASLQLAFPHSAETADRQTEIKHVQVLHGFGDGVRASVGRPIIENVDVSQMLGHAYEFLHDAAPQAQSLTASNNQGGDHIAIQGGDLREDRTWDYGDLPLHIVASNVRVFDIDAASPATLTIAPGTIVKFDNGWYLQSVSGRIDARGTASEPIVFTAIADDSIGGDSNADADATTAYPGFWESIYLDGPSNAFENVEIRYAGDTNGDGIGSGAIGALELRRVADDDDQDTQTRLQNVRISDVFSNAINVQAGRPTLDTIHADGALGVPYFFDHDSAPITNELTARGSVQGDRIVVRGGDLSEDRTWDYGDLPIHLQGNNMRVYADENDNPYTLTIAPGTVVKLDSGLFFHSVTGTIEAMGTQAEPIVFTALTDDSVGGDANGDGDGSTPYPGFWESFYLDGPNNVFENVIVRYAGDTNGDGIGSGAIGAFELRRAYTPENADSQVTLSNVRIADVFSNAVNVQIGRPNLDAVDVEDALGVPFYFDSDSAPAASGLTSRGSLLGDQIAIRGGDLREDRTWDYGDLPIHLFGFNQRVFADDSGNPATLAIAPGTVVKLDSGLFLQSVSGTLRAIGTDAEPIVFTARTDDTAGGDSNGDAAASQPYPGFWETIYLDGPNNILEHVEVRYAGDTNGDGIGSGAIAAINLRRPFDAADPTTQPTLRSVSVRDTYSTGLHAQTGRPTLDQIDVRDTLGSPYFFNHAAAPIVSGLTARGNGLGDAIVIQGGNLDEDRTWDYGELPLHLTGFNMSIVNDAEGSPVTLTIAPGTIVKVGNGLFFHSISGNLIAEGTAAQPIVFTALLDDTVGGDANGDGNASTPYPGYWESIYLDGPQNSLQHVTVRYAGDTNGDGIGSGGIHAMRIGSQNPTTLEHVDFESNFAGGLHVIRAATVNYDGGSLFQSVAGPTANASIWVDDGTLVASDLDVVSSTPGDIGFWVDAGSTAIVSASQILVPDLGVRYLGNTPGDVDFRGNWWGHPGGPHDPSAADGFVNDNPPGAGVDDFVDYGGFLTEPLRAQGPRVVAAQRLGDSDGGSGANERFLFTFDLAIDPASVAVTDVSISGPQAIGVEAAELIGDRTLLITLDGPLDAGGDYTITVGPSIADTTGNLMNQDGDATAGEPIDDAFVSVFAVDRSGPMIVSQTPSGTTETVLQVIELTFDEAIDPDSVSVADALLLTEAERDQLNDSGPNENLGTRPIAVLAVDSDPSKLQFVFPPQPLDGLYEFRLSSSVRDVSGNLMNPDSYTSEITVDRQPLRIVSQSP
ncbi:MAG: Ig-like domain-containing protein, partial [Planctomycetota bacterium]